MGACSGRERGEGELRGARAGARRAAAGRACGEENWAGPGARGREERKEREREKREKRKEGNGKKKRKRKRRGEKREKGERERFAVIPPVATATPVGHARLSRPRPAVRRDARVEGKTEFWIRVSRQVFRESGDRNREVPGKLGLGF